MEEVTGVQVALQIHGEHTTASITLLTVVGKQSSVHGNVIVI